MSKEMLRGTLQPGDRTPITIHADEYGGETAEWKQVGDDGKIRTVREHVDAGFGQRQREAVGAPPLNSTSSEQIPDSTQTHESKPSLWPLGVVAVVVAGIVGTGLLAEAGFFDTPTETKSNRIPVTQTPPTQMPTAISFNTEPRVAPTYEAPQIYSPKEDRTDLYCLVGGSAVAFVTFGTLIAAGRGSKKSSVNETPVTSKTIKRRDRR